MKTLNIKSKLTELGFDHNDMVLGDFDRIGEFAAKRERKQNDINYKRFGAFYRSNYERGVLIYCLIRQLGIKSMLEIGFGRGYSALCAAKAFYDAGIDGTITSIDVTFDQSHDALIRRVYPSAWFKHINRVTGKSQEVLKDSTSRYDFVYIDGDHTYDAVKADWELVRGIYDKAVLFDDYHMSTKSEEAIQCSKLINEIDHVAEGCSEPELIITDRRMFIDDRGYGDSEVDYGQVLFTKSGTSGMNEW